MKRHFIGTALIALWWWPQRPERGWQARRWPRTSRTMSPKWRAILSPRDRQRAQSDPLRAPAETLAFAGVKPGMTVAEFFPSGGYYIRRMLSDIVGAKGKIYGIGNPKWDKGEDAKMAAEPGYGYRLDPVACLRGIQSAAKS